LANIDCLGDNSSSNGYGIARDPAAGGFDILFSDVDANEYVQRFAQSAGSTGNTNRGSNIFTTNLVYLALAVDNGGHEYIDDNAGNVLKFKNTATGNATANQTFSVGASSGALAVSPIDLTLFVVVHGGGPGGVDVVNKYAPADYGGLATATAPSRGQIFFGAGANVTALATDSQGGLYVGLTNANGARVKYYPAGATTPTRNLQALNGDTNQTVTGIAVYEPGH
jgi:hypothetical protein